MTITAPFRREQIRVAGEAGRIRKTNEDDSHEKCMDRSEVVYLKVAPNPAGGWHVTVSASGEPGRVAKYNQIAQETAAELRQKYSLKT